LEECRALHATVEAPVEIEQLYHIHDYKGLLIGARLCSFSTAMLSPCDVKYLARCLLCKAQHWWPRVLNKGHFRSTLSDSERAELSALMTRVKHSFLYQLQAPVLPGSSVQGVPVYGRQLPKAKAKAMKAMNAMEAMKAASLKAMKAMKAIKVMKK